MTTSITAIATDNRYGTGHRQQSAKSPAHIEVAHRHDDWILYGLSTTMGSTIDCSMPPAQCIPRLHAAPVDEGARVLDLLAVRFLLVDLGDETTR